MNIFKLLLLVTVAFSMSAYSQKQAIPVECDEIKDKLTQIKNSIHSLDSWTKQRTGRPDEGKWTTNFLMCGVEGFLQIRENNYNKIYLSFDFESEEFESTKSQRLGFVEKFKDAIGEVFSKSFTSDYLTVKDPYYSEDSDMYRWQGYRGRFKTTIELTSPWQNSLVFLLFTVEKM